VIALIGNRPAIQVGRHQVHDYDTVWLGRALQRAAAAADLDDFPFLDEIRKGIEEYLETKCHLELLTLEALFLRMRTMLEKIGCGRIAEKLEPIAPPVTFSLEGPARDAGNGFELAFFEIIRTELTELRAAGTEEIHFTGIKESVLILRRSEKWDESCDKLLTEIRNFLRTQDLEHRRGTTRPFDVHVEGQRIA